MSEIPAIVPQPELPKLSSEAIEFLINLSIDDEDAIPMDGDLVPDGEIDQPSYAAKDEIVAAGLGAINENGILGIYEGSTREYLMNLGLITKDAKARFHVAPDQEASSI